MRANTALATDFSRNEVVMFGGWGSSAMLGDTWLWTDAGFRRALPAFPPPPRRGHAMAYDSARQRVVLFGGQLGATLYQDTWEWDGASWQQRASSGPPARWLCALAYDAARQRTLLTGGLTATGHLADTWEWDGTSWTQRSSTVTPPARGFHAMAYDEQNQRIVMFGGQGALPQMDDTWLWDGSQWSAGPLGPQARWGHAMTYDPSRNRIVLAGGRNQSGLLPNEVWEWGGVNWVPRSFLSSSPPTLNYACAMAYDPQLQRPVVFGGHNAQNQLTGQRGHWDALSQSWVDTVTRVRSFIQATAVGARQRVVALRSERPGTVEWDGVAWHLSHLGTPPNPIAFADEGTNRAILLGGPTQDQTWAWDGGTWQQLSPPIAPPARWGAAMTLDPLRQRIVLFGGLNPAGGHRQDTWEWDGSQWLPTSPAVSPPAREGHAMAFDENLGSVVLFGGKATGVQFADVWRWTGSSWQQLVFPGGPSPRHDAAMAFDRARQALVVIGGVYDNQYPLSPTTFAETWDLTAAGWIQGGNLPTADARGHAAYDAIRGNVTYLTWSSVPDQHLAGGNAVTSAVDSIGPGCAGTLGVPALQATPPTLGGLNSWAGLRNVVPGSICVTAWSTNSTPVAIGGGCTLYLDANFVLTAVLADATGVAEHGFPIPMDLSLRGLQFYLQGACFDPANPIGLALSDGFAMTIGD